MTPMEWAMLGGGLWIGVCVGIALEKYNQILEAKG